MRLLELATKLMLIRLTIGFNKQGDDIYATTKIKKGSVATLFDIAVTKKLATVVHIKL
jgi:hypothetical protein